MKTLHQILIDLNACGEAVAWAKRKRAEVAWQTCPRGDWLLWIAFKVGVGRKLVVRAACRCARPLVAIETAERWCDGKTTIEEVRRAAAAAAAAEAAYAAAYAADAAYAAAHAAYAVHVAAHAAYAAESAYAADAAAYAAYAAKMHAACADAVREVITWDIIKPLAEKLAAA